MSDRRPLKRRSYWTMIGPVVRRISSSIVVGRVTERAVGGARGSGVGPARPGCDPLVAGPSCRHGRRSGTAGGDRGRHARRRCPARLAAPLARRRTDALCRGSPAERGLLRIRGCRPGWAVPHREGPAQSGPRQSRMDRSASTAHPTSSVRCRRGSWPPSRRSPRPSWLPPPSLSSPDGQSGTGGCRSGSRSISLNTAAE
jgi:hypothetical protein